MSADAPRDHLTDGHYPFGAFGTPEDRGGDLDLAAAWQLAQFARHVKQYMTVHNVKQSALARRAGVSQAAVSDLLTGAAWSRGDIIAKLLWVTGAKAVLEAK